MSIKSISEIKRINVNPNFMKNILTTKRSARVQPFKSILRDHKTAIYEGKSPRILGSKNGIRYLQI